MNPNPILKNYFSDTPIALQSEPMTVSGVMNKLGIMAVLMTISGAATWYQFAIGNLDKVKAIMWIGLIAGCILTLLAMFVRKSAPFTIPLYAFAEGAFLAALSCYFESVFPGIVVRAVILTFITVFGMYFLYATKSIIVTEKLKSTTITLTLSIAIFYVLTAVLSVFHIHVPMLYDSSPISILFSVFVCGVAAFNLLIDFDFIEQASHNMFPKEYEWFGAFGLVVTIVWLYIEVLRLLSKLQRR